MSRYNKQKHQSEYFVVLDVEGKGLTAVGFILVRGCLSGVAGAWPFEKKKIIKLTVHR